MQRPIPKESQKFLKSGDFIVSKTNSHGKITYGNEIFIDISGYSEDELLDAPHSILRHPDMPKAAFAQVWKTIQSGTIWHGLVKNLRKDGKYYWVDTEVTPMLDANGKIKGYIAARKPASRKNIEETAEIYKKMLAQEN